MALKSATRFHFRPGRLDALIASIRDLFGDATDAQTLFSFATMNVAVMELFGRSHYSTCTGYVLNELDISLITGALWRCLDRACHQLWPLTSSRAC
jgi:hypothetical protein